MVDLSIIIVSYNTRELTVDCLRSLYAETKEVEFEVIVVDNNSTDKSEEAILENFPQVHLLALDENLGFAGGNNLGVKEAQGRRLLLLNPDTIVLDRAIDHLFAFAEEIPDCNIWGGRTVFEDGTLNPGSCWGKPTPWSVFCRATGISRLFLNASWCDSESMATWKRDSIRHVDIVSGCFFMIDRDLWERLAGFDAAFFMYGEEVDLCLRSRAMGASPMVTPVATIIHYGGRSDTIREDQTVRQFQAKSRLYKKHWGGITSWFMVSMLTVWSFRRLFVGYVLFIVRFGKCQDLSTWRNIWRRRREWQG